MFNCRLSKNTLLTSIAACLAVVAQTTSAEDIDIFIGSSGTAQNPNILIVIDNTSNWSQQAQHWPNGLAQGQSEVNAIKTVLGALGDNVNIGLLEYVTGSGGGNDGGYIRQAIVPMTAANKTSFQTRLTTIYNNINSTDEKVSSNMPYGNLLFDAYNYFKGSNAYAASGKVPPTLADATGYNPAYTKFKSPIESSDCGKNYIIFIGNGFPNTDDSTLLSGAGGDTTKIPLPGFTTTVTAGACADRGYQASCVSNAGQCVTTDYTVQTAGDSLICDTTRSSTASCSNGKKKYMVQECAPDTTTVSSTGNYALASPTSKERYADEWTRFLYRTDVSAETGTQNVTTYTIDVFKDQQDADQTALLMSMAKVGGGKYFAATNEDAIVNALKQILTEIQAVNTTFASAALPVSTTNRAENKNQVFIPLFRPDQDAKPRWVGNLKQYQLILTNGSVELGDANGASTINPLTGYPTECATSFWTSSSGAYWNFSWNPNPASQCSTINPADPTQVYNDSPDGPFVEKGGVAEVIRKGNNPPTTNTTPTWATNRTIYTGSSAPLSAFTTASSGLSSSVVNFIIGQDTTDENANGNFTETRPSIHGDTIHSRPLPVDYGGATGVTVYYGANDGVFRAIDSNSGKERWGYIAPEHYSKLSRLVANSPQISYPNMPAGIVPTPTAKDYFFDGNIGLYQNADNSKVWIFPSMRRGGRMVYAFDVTNPASPVFKWKVGCPNLTDDTSCTSGMSGIGQTWSTPIVAFVKGYSTTAPVIITGGGYDSCEDTNSSAPTCTSAKGKGIYILDADTGALIRSFTTTRSVAADVAVLDMNADGYVDVAYAADTGGNIYRIDLTDGPGNNYAERTSASWTSNRVAYTNGAGRKFLYPPALLSAGGGKVILAIATGDREHPLISQYPYTSNVGNRFYMDVDNLASTSAYNLDDTTYFEDFTTTSACNDTGVLPTSTKKGWFMDLTESGQGEQAVTSALIAGGKVTFSTNRPVPTAENSCATSLGEARSYWLNLFNACGTSNTFVGGGLPPSPVMGRVAISVNGQPVIKTVILGAANDTCGSALCPQQVNVPVNQKRKLIYWKFPNSN